MGVGEPDKTQPEKDKEHKDETQDKTRENMLVKLIANKCCIIMFLLVAFVLVMQHKPS